MTNSKFSIQTCVSNVKRHSPPAHILCFRKATHNVCLRFVDAPQIKALPDSNDPKARGLSLLYEFLQRVCDCYGASRLDDSHMVPSTNVR